MVDRTRLYRGKGGRIGSELSRLDPEVFDDGDFYQQLLRDVIDARNGGSGGQDWIQAQKERKKKKVVDTKASKGRKIRWKLPSPPVLLKRKTEIGETGIKFMKNSKTSWCPSP